MTSKEKKDAAIPLRVSKSLKDKLTAYANVQQRSVNGQIVLFIQEGLKRAGIKF
ncbi:MAG: hypothetical protein HRT90_11640 [Candidatus Margulisbacteria bacterium]|nr:hypothetical protein [Candidatus Margulisiibacteriota bacterium]